jgi:hypothetical protein
MSTNPLPLQLNAPPALVLELLRWVAMRPRTYRETMEAWRTSCPRLPIWEDAIDNGLVAVVPSAGDVGEQTVSLTPRGRTMLAGLGDASSFNRRSG